MASVFAVSETFGAQGSPTTQDCSYVHLLSSDVASGNSTNHTNYPVSIPPSGTNYSYGRFIRGHWTGTFSTISSVKFWKSAGSLGTGVSIKAAAKGNQTYASPVTTASAIATADIPTAVGSALAPAYATNFSDYIVLQLHVASTASPGAIGSQTYSFQWLET